MVSCCLVCAELTGHFKHDMKITTHYTKRPIWMLFESCMSLKLPPDIIETALVCQNCLIKFNEIDEHQMIVDQIQSEMLQLYQISISLSTDAKKDFKHGEEEFLLEIVDELEEIQQEEKKSKPKKRQPAIKREPGVKAVSRKKKIAGPLQYSEHIIDGKRFWKCHICQNIIYRRPYDHIKIHTDVRNFECDICNALFKRKEDRNRHRLIHGERKRMECDLCGRKYFEKFQLRLHIDTAHLMKRDFICAICGKTLAREQGLKNHMRLHSALDKNIVCSLCGFRTHAKSKLKRHMLSHTGVRNYSCEICGKRFLYSYNVQQHINYVHKRIRAPIDESKYTCGICGQKMKKQWMVREHLQKEHNVVEEVNEIFTIEEITEEIQEHLT